MKRIVSLMLVVVMALGALTGCGNGNTSSGEKKTLTVGIPQGSAVTSYDENALTKYFEENLNMDIEFVLFSNANEAMNQLSLMCAAGDELPDVLIGFSGISSLMMVQYGEDGFFLELSDLIEEYGENFNAQMKKLPKEEQERVTRAMSNPDTGEIFGMPLYSSMTIADYLQEQMTINKDWLEAVGMEAPKNITELYDVLTAFKEQDPNGNGKADEIPMLSPSIYRYIINAYVYYDSERPLNITDGKVWSPTTTEEYRQALIYIRNIYDEGLINFTTSSNDAKNTISGEGTTAKVGIWSGHPSLMTNYTAEVLNQYEALEPLADETGKGGYIVEKPKDLLLSAFITKDCKDTEAAMKFLDFCYKDESVTRARHGEKGEYWEEVEEAQPSSVGTPSKIKVLNADVYTAGNVTWGAYMPNIYTNENYLAIAETGAGRMADVARIYGAQTELMLNWKKPEETVTGLAFTLKEQQDLEKMGGTILTTISEYFALYVTGEMDPADDADWNEYLKKMEKSGLNDQIKIYQTAYDRK